MKKISLKTDSPFFRPEQFETEMFNGREIPVMKISREEYLNESFMFSLYSLGLDAIPYVKDDTGRKYLCVTDSFYIVVERGEKGFDTSFHYFSADVKTKGDEISVTIGALEDRELTGEIYGKFIENECSVADCFNEKNMAFSKSHNSLGHLKMIESTEFIRLPYKGNQRKIMARLGYDSKLTVTAHSDYRFLDSGKHITGDIAPGTLFYIRDPKVRNKVDIVKLRGFAHDFNGEFWAVLEEIYSYPADAEKIKEEYPDFYDRECASDAIIEKNELLKTAKELPYIRREYKIGDRILHMPVEMTAAEISIPVGELHFAVGAKCYGHLAGREKGRLRLNGLPLLCSLAEIDRRFKLLYYKATGFVKCGDSYYAELKLERQSNFFDSLDTDWINFQDMEPQARAADKAAMACAGYLMFRNIITPVIIDKDNAGENITKE